MRKEHSLTGPFFSFSELFWRFLLAGESGIGVGVAEGEEDSLCDGIPQSDYLRQTCGLQSHLFEKAGSIDDTSDIDITHGGKFLLYTGSRIEGTVSDGNVSEMFFGSQGSVHGDEQRTGMPAVNNQDRMRQIQSVNRVMYCSVDGQTF